MMILRSQQVLGSLRTTFLKLDFLANFSRFWCLLAGKDIRAQLGIFGGLSGAGQNLNASFSPG